MRRPALPTRLLLAVAALAACTAPPPVPPPARQTEMTPHLPVAPLAEAGMDPALSARLDSIVETALAAGASPGAALAVGRYGRLVHLRGYGRLDWPEGSPAVTDSTLYDLASLTKVIGTTTAAMILEEEGRLDLDRPVSEYLPELDAPEKAGITVRMLLTHRGGLESFAPLYRDFRGREAYLEQIDLRPLRATPGTTTVYSDWDMVLLQLVIERITGRPLDELLAERVFRPLGMRETGYNPGPELVQRVAPTEVQPFRGGLVHGSVHDENAWAMGGVAGHAGLFGSARDLAVFARMMLRGGEHGGVRVLRPATVARWTARQGPESSRALGWDTPSPGSSAGRYFSPWSFGHTGFTGTSLWIDPRGDLFVILLTNRVNPTRENQEHVPLRRAVADAVQAAVRDVPLVEWEERRRRTDAPPP